MKIHVIDSVSDPVVAPYARLTEAQLRSEVSPQDALFIVESPKVIEVALRQGYRPVSLLCEERHIEGDARGIIDMLPDDVAIYTGSREVLAAITGYKLTRGVLCAMRRPQAANMADILRGARRVCVIHSVCDTTNIGSIFRSAAALGMDAIILSDDSCDPFNRRSVRVSMGSVFLVPWAWSSSPVDDLRRFGFKTAAMALRHESIALDDARLKKEDRLAFLLGTEGDGLPEHVIDSCDYVVKIPMAHGVDSLNVGAAAAVAFWEIGKRR